MATGPASPTATRRIVQAHIEVDLPDPVGRRRLKFTSDTLMQLEDRLDPLLVKLRRQAIEELSGISPEQVERVTEMLAAARVQALEALVDRLEERGLRPDKRVAAVLTSADAPLSLGAAGIPHNVWDAVTELVNRWPLRISRMLLEGALAHDGVTPEQIGELPPGDVTSEAVIGASMDALQVAFGQTGEDVPDPS